MTQTDIGPLNLKWPDWPAAHREAWNALFVEGDILDDAGPLAHLRAPTRAKRAESYGSWLAFLARTGQLSETACPTDPVTPEAVRAYVDATLARCSVVTTHLRVVDLGRIVRAMAPGSDWHWLENAEWRLQRMCAHAGPKPRAGVTARQLYQWGLAWMEKAQADETLSPMERAVRFRQGLVVALLIARPVRRRTFLGLRIGKSLVEKRGHFMLALKAEDLKDNKARDFPLPQGLDGPMARYLSHHRTILLDGAQSDALWITKDGQAMSKDGFVGSLVKLTRREFGEALRPHAFRHIAATSVALDDPENVHIIATILGHATLRTSERYYNHARGIEAVHALQGVVRDLRKSAGTQRPRAGVRRPRMNREVPARP